MTKRKTTRTSKARTKRPRKTSIKAKTRVKTRHGAIEIQNGLGKMKTARSIARSLKQAADASENLTTAPFQAAMAALDHLIEFLDRQRSRLEAAKKELRKLYGEVLDDEPNRKRHQSDDSSKRGRARSKKSDMAVMSA